MTLSSEAPVRFGAAEHANPVRARRSRGALPSCLATTAALTSLVLVWLRSASAARQPLVYADEAGYLLNARALAGVGKDAGTEYFPGYSLLLAPIFRATTDFTTAWDAVRVVNLALLLCSYFVLRRLLLEFEQELPLWIASVVAGTALLFPSLHGFAALGLGENAVVPAFLIVSLFAVRGLRSASRRPLVLLGATATASVAVHPRLVIVPLGVAAALLIDSWRQRSVAGLVPVLAGAVPRQRRRVRSARHDRHAPGLRRRWQRPGELHWAIQDRRRLARAFRNPPRSCVLPTRRNRWTRRSRLLDAREAVAQ